MGNDISPGYIYNTSTQKNVTAANLNQAIGDSTLKETAISAKTLKTAAASDEILASDGSGTLKKITANAIAALAVAPTIPTEVPAGIIANFAVNSTPTGWLPCNGSAILISSYSTLSTAIYCGDANNATATFGYKVTDSGGLTRSTSGTFIVLPDLRGYFVRGFDNGRGIDTGRTFGSVQQDSVIDHTHNYNRANVVSTVAISGSTGFMGSNTAVASAGVNSPNNGGTETRPKNISLGYYIKF